MYYPARRLLQSPAFTAVALITLALGIGVNTAAFTVLNRLLLFAQPYTEPNRLVQVWATIPQWASMSESPGEFCAIRDQAKSLENVSFYYLNYSKSIVRRGHPAERTSVLEVAPGFLPALGLTPMLGRNFSREDLAQQAAVVMLSHAYWKKNFDSDPSIIGQTLRYDGKDATIVGILPQVMDDPQLWGGRVDLCHADLVDSNRQRFDIAWYQIVARLKPSATLAQAQGELTVIANQLAKDFPKTNAQRGQRVARFAPDYLGEIGRTLTWLMMGLASAVLLIACVNLANLQLVRTTARSRELAIRLALGASRGHLVSQLLQESLLLSLGGGVIGLLLAKWSNVYLSTRLDTPLPLNLRVLGFAFLVTTLTGLLSGCIPALLAVRQDLNSALKQSGRGVSTDRSRHRLRHTLIIVELALALTLLTGAAFFVEGIHRVTSRELGWEPSHLLLGSFELPYERFGEEGDPRSLQFEQKFQPELARLSGVMRAVITVGSPVTAFPGTENVTASGQTLPAGAQQPITAVMRVSPGFFDAYGIPLLRGREFRETDLADSPAVAVINETLAKRLFPHTDPIGQHLKTPGANSAPDLEVVGIARDIEAGADYGPGRLPLQMYTAWKQRPVRFISFTIKTAGPPSAMADTVRRVLNNLEPDIAITFLETAPKVLDDIMSGFALFRRILLQLAALGLVLASVGIYGVVANLTTERTQEVGVRMALGAQPSAVVWLFLRTGIRLALTGALIGVLLSIGLVRLLAHSVSIIPGNDPWTIFGMALLLIAVTVIACWLPTRRAARVNPVIALRAE